MKASRLLRKLDYLPRWAWYLISLSVIGPFGALAVYLGFHALEKAAKDEKEEGSSFFDMGQRSYESARRTSAGTQRAYQDEECTVSSDEDIERRWQRTEDSAARAYAQQQTQQHSEETIPEDAAVSEVIREGREALRAIRHANDLIPDPALSAQINSIENSCRQILTILEQRPQLLSQLRTFLRYYLPTTLHLLDARAKLENTANTPKARQVRERISEALGVIDKAFLKQVEALDEYRFIDLESEMDVLSDMLRADGLVEEATTQEYDPFAQVLKTPAPAAPRRAQEDEDPFAEVMQQRSSARRGTKAAESDDQNKNIPMATH